MIICGRSQNPFLPSCCALGQERIFRAPADDHALENVYYPYKEKQRQKTSFGAL
ncbi:hypothetical protein DPMN_107458 [Dreissena polymorpha]|uniref:Uncharacterized protein n=1 Tax=Dreissena polymorpha TaxID=45954 RepID=A0A9D4K733_DREPO|nr:hypothetical protein DPMN_107458 [Dreissena polymorpha]